MPKRTNKQPPPLKNLKAQWKREREIEMVRQAEAAYRYGTKAPEPPPEKNSPQEVELNLEKALQLPAAQLPILKLANVDVMKEKILANLHTEVDVASVMELFPDLDPELQIEIAKLNEARQGRSLEMGNKLISSLIRAQKQVAPSNSVNVQINTGDVRMPGQEITVRTQDQSRPQSAPSTPPDDLDG